MAESILVLFFTFGPCGAGKTELLCRDVAHLVSRGMTIGPSADILTVKPSIDTRGDAAQISSRTGSWVPAALRLGPEDRITYKPWHAVFVDEAQFLTAVQVADLVGLATAGVSVHTYGLRADAWGATWPASLLLLEAADSVAAIPGVCAVCGDLAAHTGKFDEQGQRVPRAHAQRIECGYAAYSALCRSCFSSHAMRSPTY